MTGEHLIRQRDRTPNTRAPQRETGIGRKAIAERVREGPFIPRVSVPSEDDITAKENHHTTSLRGLLFLLTSPALSPTPAQTDLSQEK